MTDGTTIKAAKQPQKRQLPPPPDQTEPEMPRPAEVPGGILDFSNKGAPPERRSVLFRIDGVEFTVLDNPSASLGLEYLEQQRTRGAVNAVAWAMDAMLGTEAYAALRACKNLPAAGLARVVEVVLEKLDGSMTPPKEGDED